MKKLTIQDLLIQEPTLQNLSEKGCVTIYGGAFAQTAETTIGVCALAFISFVAGYVFRLNGADMKLRREQASAYGVAQLRGEFENAMKNFKTDAMNIIDNAQHSQAIHREKYVDLFDGFSSAASAA